MEAVLTTARRDSARRDSRRRMLTGANADPHATISSLETLGVPARTLLRAPRKEWRRLQAELDRFYAFGCGGATQRAFLHSPHPKLSGETPAEVLRRHDGIAAVHLALRCTLLALRSS